MRYSFVVVNIIEANEAAMWFDTTRKPGCVL